MTDSPMLDYECGECASRCLRVKVVAAYVDPEGVVTPVNYRHGVEDGWDTWTVVDPPPDAPPPIWIWEISCGNGHVWSPTPGTEVLIGWPS